MMIRETQLQRGETVLWSEREIRRLLRLLKRPYLLEGFPLAQALCSATDIENPYEAVTAVLKQAFDASGAAGKRLFEVIRRCDLEGELTQAAASDMGLSDRQFFRYRSDAVHLISAYIRNLLEVPPEKTRNTDALARLIQNANPAVALELYALGEEAQESVEELEARIASGDMLSDISDSVGARPASLLNAARLAYAREIHGERKRAVQILDAIREKLYYKITHLRSEIEFETAIAEFTVARHDGNSRRMKEILPRLRSASAENEQLGVRALLCEAEAAIASGDADRAAEKLLIAERNCWRRHDTHSMAVAMLLKAHVAFLRGAGATAHRLALCASIALRAFPYEYAQCEIFLARLNLLSGSRVYSEPVKPFAANAWATIFEAAVRARCALRNDDIAGARQLASDVAERALLNGYEALLGWNAATLGALAAHEKSGPHAQQYLRAALQSQLVTGNALCGRDIFIGIEMRPKDLGPLVCDPAFDNLLAAELAPAYPSSPLLSSAGAAAAFSSALRTMALAALDDRSDSQLLVQAATVCFSALPAAGLNGTSLRRHFTEIVDAACNALETPLPFESRERFRANFRRNCARFAERLAALCDSDMSRAG